MSLSVLPILASVYWYFVQTVTSKGESRSLPIIESFSPLLILF
jgi:hypothetical protein